MRYNMNGFYNFEMPEDYVNTVKSQPHIPGQDFVPTVIKNVLDEADLKLIRDHFNNYPEESIRVQGHNGQGAININFSDKKHIIEKIEKIVSDICGEEIEVLEVNATRYSPSFGWFVKFGPHYDARPVEMFVFDYHVQTNEDWGVFVEGKKFNIDDNDALLFNGTGQVHWREPKKLSKDANIDVILFWMQHKNPRKISKEHAEIMKLRANMVLDSINPPPTLEKEDWWKSIEISNAVLKYPDFKKISSEHKNPLSHNIFNNTFINLEEISGVFSPSSVDIQKITNKVIEQVTVFMTHVHAESVIEYLGVKGVRITEHNSQTINRLYDKNVGIVSLAIQVNSNSSVGLVIGGEVFAMNNSSAITLSPTNQDIDIVLDSNDGNSFVDLLLFDFLLKEVY